MPARVQLQQQTELPARQACAAARASPARSRRPPPAGAHPLLARRPGALHPLHGGRPQARPAQDPVRLLQAQPAQGHQGGAAGGLRGGALGWAAARWQQRSMAGAEGWGAWRLLHANLTLHLIPAPIPLAPAYHHGEASLAGTIVGLAQDFVGSNNIHYLVPQGEPAAGCLLHWSGPAACARRGRRGTPRAAGAPAQEPPPPLHSRCCLQVSLVRGCRAARTLPAPVTSSRASRSSPATSSTSTTTACLRT